MESNIASLEFFRRLISTFHKINPSNVKFALRNDIAVLFDQFFINASELADRAGIY